MSLKGRLRLQTELAVAGVVGCCRTCNRCCCRDDYGFRQSWLLPVLLGVVGRVIGVVLGTTTTSDRVGCCR